jgi:hypothetical protein
MADATPTSVNEVYLDDHEIIHAVYHGPQSASLLLDTTTQVLTVMQKLVDEDKPVRLLADIRDLGPYDQPARIVEMQARTALPFWKMAFVATGKQEEGEKMSRLLTSMSARKEEIRYFRREDDAEGWLSFMREKGWEGQRPVGSVG